MDEVVKWWMFWQWAKVNNINVENLQNQAYLIGSFINPEAVRDLLDKDSTYAVSDDDFEKSWEMVKSEPDESKQASNKKRKLKKAY